nr:tryptophan synthase, alpha subunit [uncultured bacterium]
MDRIEKAFRNNQPYIGYLTGGDGGIEASVNYALALIEGGVDLLEIGFPFSDPVADGPVIQKAHERALAGGTTSATLLEIARRVRKVSDVPLVLFSYFNPVLQKGAQFLNELKSAGFDAVLIVDLAVCTDTSDSEPFFNALADAGLIPILLATPSTNLERLEMISKMAKGFLYYVSQKGTTGIRSQLADDFSTQMMRMKQLFQIPVVAGFGIADRANAQAVLEHADGFVVGSAFVKLIEQKKAPKELTKFAQSIDPRKEAIA